MSVTINPDGSVTFDNVQEALAWKAVNDASTQPAVSNPPTAPMVKKPRANDAQFFELAEQIEAAPVGSVLHYPTPGQSRADLLRRVVDNPFMNAVIHLVEVVCVDNQWVYRKTEPQPIVLVAEKLVHGQKRKVNLTELTLPTFNGYHGKAVK